LASWTHLGYQIEKEAGNYLKALEYHVTYSQYVDTISDNRDRDLLLEMQRKYDISVKENAYNMEKSRLWKIIAITGCISLALLIAVLLIQNRNRKHKSALAISEQERKEKELNLERVSMEIFEKQMALENAVSENEKIKQSMKSFIKQNNQTPLAFLEKMGFIKDIALLQDTKKENLISNIAQIFFKYNLQNYIKITEELLPQFTEKLKRSFPDIRFSELETCICCFVVCGFTNTDISIFIHSKTETDAIVKMKNRLRRKMDIPANDDMRVFLLKIYSAQ
jgi:hypothetical protein